MSTLKEKFREGKSRKEEEAAQALTAQQVRERQEAEFSRKYEAEKAALEVEFDRKVQQWRKIVKKSLCELAEETVADGRMLPGFSFTEDIDETPDFSFSLDEDVRKEYHCDTTRIHWEVESKSPVHRKRFLLATEGDDGDYRTRYHYGVTLYDFEEFGFYCNGRVDPVPVTKEALEEALVEMYSYGPCVSRTPLYPDSHDRGFYG